MALVTEIYKIFTQAGIEKKERGNRKMDLLILSHVVILVFLIATALAAIMARDLLESVIIYSAYSFTISVIYSILRATDVSMTEAAVGAGISSILFVAALCKTKRRED